MTTRPNPDASAEDAQEPQINDNEASADTVPAAEDGSQGRIAELESALSAMKDQWVRALAEAENVRKRAQREVEDSSKYAVSNFARDLIGVAENLQRALDSVSAEARAEDGLLKTLAEGVQMTLSELLSTFERYGIKRLNPRGEKFDHNFHQAVAQVEDAEVEPGSVAQVFQAGYTLHGRLLRPAMVAVAKPKSAEQKIVDTSA